MIKRLRDEEGAVIIIAALSLVMMLGFAALAIDIAHKRNQRNEDQAAADTGVMAAALQVPFKTTAQGIADAETEAIRITYETIQPINVSFAQWDTAWGSCTDANKPAEYTIDAPNTSCISFTDNLNQVRVVLPIVDVETTFGKVVGVNSMPTTAFAEAATGVTPGVGNILPFGLPGSGLGPEVCLKTGPQPDGPPCDGPVTGNFGFLDFALYGVDLASIGVSEDCSFSNAPKKVAENIAHGVDHRLGTYVDPPGTVRHDLVECPNDVNSPNATDTATGNMAKVIEDGFIEGAGIFAGRLTVLPSQAAPGGLLTHPDVHGEEVDATPLWHYITAGCPGVVDKAAMNACLGAGAPITYDASIGDNPRFVWVPELTVWEFPNGNKTVLFEDFRPVYIETFWGKCGGTGCDNIWVAGDTASSFTHHDFIAVSAYLLDRDDLPLSVQIGQPGLPDQFQYFLIR